VPPNPSPRRRLLRARTASTTYSARPNPGNGRKHRGNATASNHHRAIYESQGSTYAQSRNAATPAVPDPSKRAPPSGTGGERRIGEGEGSNLEGRLPAAACRNGDRRGGERSLRRPENRVGCRCARAWGTWLGRIRRMKGKIVYSTVEASGEW
jgi:hypothetical protein